MSKKTDKELQNILFKKIQESIPSNRSLVDDIADLLKVSTDSAYRRLRGQTILSIGETDTICKHYNICFDNLYTENSSAVSFNFLQLQNEQDFHKLLLYIIGETELFAKTPDVKLYYAAIDIPIFHHFNFRELTSFKIFYWLKSVINAPLVEKLTYSPNFLPDETFSLCSQALETYKQFNSTEIWTDSTVNSLIKQISYFWESGLFTSKKDALTICDQAEQEILNIRNFAENSSKGGGKNNFNLFFSEIEIGNNSIFAVSKEYKRAYLSHNTINVMGTTHSVFCNETERWMNNLLKKSILISSTSEKIRYQFFNRALTGISSLRDEINNQ